MFTLPAGDIMNIFFLLLLGFFKASLGQQRRRHYRGSPTYTKAHLIYLSNRGLSAPTSSQYTRTRNQLVVSKDLLQELFLSTTLRPIRSIDPGERR